MKRGFLNTNKAKCKLAEAHNSDSLAYGKTKAKAGIPADAHPPPLLSLHCAPPYVVPFTNWKADKTRFIFRHWPRDPNGEPIVPSDIHGKEAANGLNLWGATLYDFYFVRRIPSSVHGLTISSGSKLAKVVQALGELEYARDEIAWAAREADPKEVPGWDPAEAIVAYERRVHAGFGIVEKVAHKTVEEPVNAGLQMLDVSEPVASQELSRDAGEATKEEGTLGDPNLSGQPASSMDEVGVLPRPSDIPMESPFHPCHYPSPWPLPPFESPYSPFTLQRQIPIHLLPKKLYVHDPWKLVDANFDIFYQENKPNELIHTYTLSLPPGSQELARDQAQAAVAAEDKALDTPETIFIPPQETDGPTEQPAIRAFLPRRPRKLTEVSEAHLYLSPRGKLGIGNHSVVYEAELEFPRDLFCDSTYCKSCLDGQIKAEIDKLKQSGEWEQQLDEGVKTYNGPGVTSDPSPSPASVQTPRYVGFVRKRLERVHMETADIVTATTFGEAPPPDAPSQFVRLSESGINSYIEYQGLVVAIYPKVQWQNPSFPDTICEHQVEMKKPVPRTARFRVAAKLSFRGDPHLLREAHNYLKFPAHFFQHWTGYNVIPPLHDPTPVGALVPQFFGYYVPDAPSDDEYSSPILLVEHCGEPISVNTLSIDEQHECAALLFRFHCAGWLHESFAERNILKRRGHPTCNPLEQCRCEMPHQLQPYSFRLIDFGRSVEYADPSRRAVEESSGKKLFGIL